MNDFPMPKTVEMPRTEYAPKRANHSGVEAVAAEIERAVMIERATQAAMPRPPVTDYKPPKHVDSIKNSLRLLTHREMRELVAAIFAAHKLLDNVKEMGPNDSIPMAHMADVLDRFCD